MDYTKVLQTVAVVIVGSLLLRIAGRKSLAQTTVAETVVMISIGSLLVQPLAEESILVTLGVALTMVLTTRALSYFQLKYNSFEKLFTGKSLTVIENGTLNTANMAMIGLTVDQLEMQLRQANVRKIDDVKWGTIEPNGRLGFTLKDGAMPITKDDLLMTIQALEQRLRSLVTDARNQSGMIAEKNPLQRIGDQKDIFTEIARTSDTNSDAGQIH